ncbi:hypothetical protein B0H65DRAFT_310205 [Neurospora tetraspora]|uniref:Uncharacterized protein n=1 Tax=Neurospora tetraspora TaxID=94610 RepID=A0AAE0J7I8_9PEZI|nr:hypothetical protein B0H65DRAFT_310205 [Neurospora tetraspora]
MPRLHKAHGSAPYIYITSPDSSNSSISASASDFTPGSNSPTSSDSSSSSSSSAAAAAWRSNASELRDVTRDFSAARATSTDAKTKSYTEKEVARFEAMARNAELMASMAMAASAAKRRDGVSSKCA